MEKEVLVDQLKVVLATAYSLSIKAQNYHWNVTGENFGEYHDFFGDYYTKVNEFIDIYAEHIRQLDVFAPGSLARFSELTKISDELSVPSPKFMFIRLASDNMLFIEILKNLRAQAEEYTDFGLVSTVEDALRFHSKMQWMMKARTDS